MPLLGYGRLGFSCGTSHNNTALATHSEYTWVLLTVCAYESTNRYWSTECRCVQPRSAELKIVCFSCYQLTYTITRVNIQKRTPWTQRLLQWTNFSATSSENCSPKFMYQPNLHRTCFIYKAFYPVASETNGLEWYQVFKLKDRHKTQTWQTENCVCCVRLPDDEETRVREQ